MRRTNSRYIFFSLVVFLGFMFFTLPQANPLNSLKSSDDNRSFEALYERYVDLTIQQKCEGKIFTCKEFYLAQNTAIKEPSIAIVYYQKAYENGISTIIDDPNAKDNTLFSNLANAYALLGELENARLWYERSIAVGEERNMCKLGKIYRDMQQYDKAYALFTKGHETHFEECTQELGTFYFNGTYVEKDTKKGSDLWKEAYKDDSFGVDMNYNMAVYHANISNDLNYYKYHLLKAALQNDKDAKEYLSEDIMKRRNVSHLFLEEAIREEKEENSFKYAHELYYRFMKFYNEEGLWNDSVDDRQENVVLFIKDEVTLSFGPKKLSLTLPLSKESLFEEGTRLVLDTLYVDTPLSLLNTLSQSNKAFKQALQSKSAYERAHILDEKISWRHVYGPLHQKLSFEIVLK